MSKWTSIKNRLPESNKYVFVTKRNKGNILYGKLVVDIACCRKKDFKNEFYWTDRNLNEMEDEILAWMPMNFPEPYNEVE